MPGHIGAPIIHLSSSVSAALVGGQHKRCPLAPSLAPSWGKHTTTSNKKSMEPCSSRHFGLPLNPMFSYTTLLLLVVSAAQWQWKGQDALVTGFFLPRAIGCCKTRFLPQEEVGGFGWERRNEGGRLSAQLHSNTNSNKELVLAWQLAACSATRNNSTAHADPRWHKNLAWLIDILEINTVSGSCLPASLSCWPLKATFLRFDRVRKRER